MDSLIFNSRIMVFSRFVLNVLVLVAVSVGCGKHVVRSASSEKVTGHPRTGSESATGINQPSKANKDCRIETFVRNISQMHLQHSSVAGSLMVKMNKAITFLDTLNNSISELTAQVRSLPDQIQSLEEETIKDSSLQFCARGLGCKHVWPKSNQHRFRCFKLSYGTASWPDAKRNCERMGGYLAEVLDQETLEYVRAIVPSTNVWLGASDLYKEGDWRWAHSGLRVIINHWLPGQPNNYKGTEDCLHMWSSHDLKWNDNWCADQFRYLCEKFDDNCDGWN